MDTWIPGYWHLDTWHLDTWHLVTWPLDTWPLDTWPPAPGYMAPPKLHSITPITSMLKPCLAHGYLGYLAP